MKLPYEEFLNRLYERGSQVRIVTAQGVHASLQENFRSTWRNWKGGLLTRYGHRCGPTCGHLFTVIFSTRVLPSSSLLSLSFSLSPPGRPTDDCNYFCDTSPPRLFNCTHPLYRAAPQFFLPLRFTHTHLQTLFVTYRICVIQFVYFHECTMHNGKLLFAFNGSQINPRIFCEYRIVFQGYRRGHIHELT